MKPFFFSKHAALSLLLAAGLWAAPAQAHTVYLLTEDGKLASTTTENPGVVTTAVTITGVITGQTLMAIDVRPQNQKLYALGVNAVNDTLTLYHLAPETAQATPVGATVTSLIVGGSGIDFPDTRWDIDFNPSVDLVRVVSESGLNFRLNPNDGKAVDTDANPGNGTNPDASINGLSTLVSGAAYTNNQPNNGSITTQYTVDASANQLYIQTPPNSGTQTSAQAVTLAGNFLDFTTASFDIPPGINTTTSGTPVASGSGILVAKVGGITGIYTLNLVNGEATAVGTLDLEVKSSAIATDRGAAIALSTDGTTLFRFDPSAPGTVAQQPIVTAGLASGEVLAGIDGRPQTGQLIGLGVNHTADSATLYIIEPQTGLLTPIGTQGSISFADGSGTPLDFPNPLAVGYGVDFNPTVDILRVVTGTGQNFRVNPNTGSPVDGNFGGAANSVANTNMDANQNGFASGGIGATAAAYTNSFGQSLTGGVTTLYTLDAVSNSLYLQNPPNAGTQTLALPITLGGSPLDITEKNGFDIPSSVKVTVSNEEAIGSGWMVATVGGGTNVFRIKLGTGEAINFGPLGGGIDPAAGLVVWATVPELVVEKQEGFPLVDNAGTVDFETPTIGNPEVRTLFVRNQGNQPLNFSTSLDSGTDFTVTQNAAGSIGGSSFTMIEITFLATTLGSKNDVLHILSNDPTVASFEVALTANALFALGNDTVVRTGGETRINPLANDDLTGTLTITSVSDPAITIQGRTLIIPSGYTGSFTYTATNGSIIGAAVVTVQPRASFNDALNFNGLLRNGTGKIAGWAKTTIAASGIATVTVRGGVQTATAKITFPIGQSTASAFTPLGNVTLTKNGNGTASLSVGALGGSITGTLRAAEINTAAVKYHVSLASIDPAFVGGGFLIATVSKKGVIAITGTLPDGLPFTAATNLTDNGSFTFYAAATKGATPPAFIGGELLTADLAVTDATGELEWAKLPQAPTIKGLHLLGVDTVLKANGSLYTVIPPVGILPFGGAGTLTLSGGSLAMDETNAVNVVGSKPDTLPGSLKSWTATTALGKFTVKVQIPGITKPVSGAGIYLPKSRSAWGFFPGKTVGGRVRLTVP